MARRQRTSPRSQEGNDAKDHDNDTRAFGDAWVKSYPYERHLGIARRSEDQQPDPQRERKGSNKK